MINQTYLIYGVIILIGVTIYLYMKSRHSQESMTNMSCEDEGKDYLNRYPDVKEGKVDPWVHYNTFGKNEKRIWNGEQCQSRKKDYAIEINSNKCSNPNAFVRVGDKRCLTDSQCKYGNFIDKTKRDCTRVMRSTKKDYEKATSSNECINGKSFVRKGDKRCLTDTQCNYANFVDKTKRDCTALARL
jgi:hypothetical protein